MDEIVLKKLSEQYKPPPFKHEIHSLRVVDKLAELDRGNASGLNLMYEVRDGIISHNGEDFKSSFIKPSNKTKPLEEIFHLKDVGMPTTMEGTIVRLTSHWIAGVSAALKSLGLTYFIIITNKFTGNPCNQ